MATGRIVQFNQARGYGFIAPDDGGDDVFLHSEELKPYPGTVRVGTRVRFEIVDGQRGLKAYDVTVLEPPQIAMKVAEPRPGPELSRPGPELSDDDTSEIIPAADYAREITDALISFCPDVTAAQIVEIRERLTVSARKRGWLED